MGAAGSAAGPGVLRGQGTSDCKRRCLKEKHFCKHLQGNGPKGRGIILSGVVGKQQGAAGGAWRGSRSLGRAAGLGEGLCWLR